MKYWHQDNYSTREPEPTVTIGLSLGATRDLAFHHVETGQEFRATQRNGDVFAFDKPFNSCFKHSVPPARRQAPGMRMSLIVWASDECATAHVDRKWPSSHGMPEAIHRRVDWSDWTLPDSNLLMSSRHRGVWEPCGNSHHVETAGTTHFVSHPTRGCLVPGSATAVWAWRPATWRRCSAQRSCAGVQSRSRHRSIVAFSPRCCLLAGGLAATRSPCCPPRPVLQCGWGPRCGVARAGVRQQAAGRPPLRQSGRPPRHRPSLRVVAGTARAWAVMPPPLGDLLGLR